MNSSARVDHNDPEQVATLLMVQKQIAEKEEAYWLERESDPFYLQFDVHDGPPNRYRRKHQEYVERRVRLNNAIERQLRCPWKPCAKSSAYLSGYAPQTLKPIFNPIYKDTPLCLTHLYEAWRIARDAADAQARRTHEVNVADALAVDPQARELRRGQKPVQPRSAITGTIYYLRCDGYIKIGYATSLVDRLKQYPPSARLLAARPGNYHEEQREHQLLRHHLAYRREWYHPATQVLQRIDQVIAQYGPLPEVAKVQKQYVEERPRKSRVR